MFEAIRFHRRLSIGARLAVAFGVLLAGLFALGSLGVLGADRLQYAIVSMFEHDVGPMENATEIRSLMLRNRVLVTDMLLRPDAAAVEPLDAELRANIETVTRLLKAFSAGPLSAAEKALLDEFAALRVANVRDGLLVVRDAVRAGRLDEAAKVYRERVAALGPKSGELLDRLTTASIQQAEAASADAVALASRLRMFAMAATGAALLLGIVLGRSIARSITLPLADAAAAANRIAEGDLTGVVHAQSQDEVGALLRAMQGMQASLSRTVAAVRSNAESVASASAQIAQGNADLSQRTERQASALQQTAATMHQLSSTVRSNADSAGQADRLAQSASAVAQQGGAVVGEVVQTMKGINESSRQIAEIIGTIDGIAFQTNILALNAAVEAARAGEQGRGFAVVAGEVRTLAQRSAEAAREIKRLIGTSVERVEAGTALVDEAGATMSEVVASIGRVNAIVAEISGASTEQATGVAQIGQAVAEMDRATQQNSALVEQSAAAAQSLKGQAAQLVQAVATFRVAPAV